MSVNTIYYELRIYLDPEKDNVAAYELIQV